MALSSASAPAMSRNPTSYRDYTRCLWPVIEAIQALGGSALPAEVRDAVAAKLGISDAARAKVLQSGALQFDKQVNFARFHLVRDGFLDDSSPRGVWVLSDKGRRQRGFTAQEAFDIVKRVGAQSRRGSRNDQGTPVEAESPLSADSDSVFGSGYKEQLLQILRGLPPSGFERFCQRLLREQGFEEVKVTGRSHDGGIDGEGTVLVNRLVSFKVLFQCKRYEGSVRANDIRDFRGAMQGRADKGIVITTGAFTPDAKKEAVRDGVPSIELVDSEKLVAMLEGLQLGLRPIPSFEIDESFFQEFRT